MGIYAVESIFVYVVIPYCLYCMYLIKYPITKDCSYCETDNMFRKCNEGTGKMGKWCENFLNAGDIGKKLLEHNVSLLTNSYRLIFYQKYFIRKYFIPTLKDLAVEFAKLLELPGGFEQMLNAIDFSCDIPKVGDPCKTIKNALNKILSTITTKISEAFSSAVQKIKDEIVEPLMGIFDNMEEVLLSLFNSLTSVFTIIIDSLSEITKPLTDIASNVGKAILPNNVLNIIYAIIGLFAVGIMLQILIFIFGLIFMNSVPLGGLLGGFKMYFYTLLYIINTIYNLFDIDIRESPIIIILENIF